MLDLSEMAVEAVRLRRERSILFSEMIIEMQCAGLRGKEIDDLLARAEANMPAEPVPYTA